MQLKGKGYCCKQRKCSYIIDTLKDETQTLEIWTYKGQNTKFLRNK